MSNEYERIVTVEGDVKQEENPVPQAVSGPGLLEGVKRAVIHAFRDAIDWQYPDPDKVVRKFADHISMEYPLNVESYPSVWVRFSLKEIRRSGVNHSLAEVIDGQRVSYGWFEGTVTLDVMSLSSKERDQISSLLIDLLLFGRDKNKASRFEKSLSDDPYIAITFNGDSVSPGGQSENIGTPWDESALVFTDSFSFSILGQFDSRLKSGHLVRLRRIEVDGKVYATGDWV